MKDPFVHEIFQRQAARFPNRIAIESGEDTINFSKLNEWASRISGALSSIDPDKQKVVGVIMPSGIDLVASVLAIFQTGSVYLPIDLKHSQKRLTQIFDDCTPSVLITTPECKSDVVKLMRTLGNSSFRLLVLEDRSVIQKMEATLQDVVKNVAAPIQAPSPGLNPDDGCYIFYTSGSTGKAKAILGNHKSLAHFINWEMSTFDVDESVKVSQLVQLTFDASLRDIFLPLCSGGTLCIPPAGIKENVSLLISWLADRGVTFVHTVPSLFRLMVRELHASRIGSSALEALQYVLLSGEPLYAKDVVRWRNAVKHSVQLVNLYGATETTMIKTFYRIGEVSEDQSQLIPVGVPIDNTMIAIINHDHICRIGEVGEVYIKTNYATKGYLNDEKLTKSVFVQNPLVKDRVDIVYKTGDLGRYLKTKDVEILGRIDSQIKVNGIRVELEEINRAVLELENVTESFVVAFQEEYGTELVCYYTCDGVVTDVELSTHLSECLNPGTIPGYFVKMDAMPLNSNGKVDRSVLPRPTALSVELPEAEYPRGEIEQTIASIWEAVLAQPKIGRNCSFFKKGGTSLRAMQVISRIFKKYQVLITVADLFNHATVRELAHLISEKKSPVTSIELEPIEEQDHYPVSDAQKRYWLADRTAITATYLNVPSSFVLRGEVDRNALDRAFRTVVERHESLRSGFFRIHNEVRSRVFSAGQGYTGIVYHDFSNTESPLEQTRAVALKKAMEVFDLERGPLLNVTLLKLGTAHYVLTFTLHHIVSDGWSMTVLAREILTLYNTFLEKKENTLAPLRVQYKDFSVWRSKLLNGQNVAEHQAYWWNQFPMLRQEPYIPFDFERTDHRTFAGNSLVHVLNEEQTARLKACAGSVQTSVFVTLVAMLNVLLYKYSGQRNIVVGTEVANRKHRDLEQQIGIYLSTTALSNTVLPEQSLLHWITDVKNSVYNAFKYEAYPFDRLLEDLKVPHDPNRFPLFDVFILMQNMDVDSNNIPDMKGVTIDKFSISTQVSKFDLSFKFFERGNALSFTLEYNKSLYAHDTVECLRDNFLKIIGTLLDAPDTSISDFELMRRETEQESTPSFSEVSSEF